MLDGSILLDTKEEYIRIIQKKKTIIKGMYNVSQVDRLTGWPALFCFAFECSVALYAAAAAILET